MQLYNDMKHFGGDLSDNGYFEAAYHVSNILPNLLLSDRIINNGPSRCRRRMEAVTAAAIQHQRHPEAIAALQFQIPFSNDFLIDINQFRQIMVKVIPYGMSIWDSAMHLANQIDQYLAEYPDEAKNILAMRECIRIAGLHQINDEVGRWLKGGLSFSDVVFTASGTTVFDERPETLKIVA